MNKKNPVFQSFVLLTLLLLIHPTPLLAVGSSGFENASYSAKTLAQGNAVVARPEDPSTIMFNPAGLIELPGIQLSTGLQELDFRVFHRNQLTGDHQQSNRRLLPIPSFYLTANPGELLDNRFAMGVAANSPFGLSSSFPAIGAGRYTGYKNALKMVATTMAGAFKLTDWCNIGAGATNYWIYDYGQNFGYPNGNILGVAGLPDGVAITETSGYGWGWNLGLLLKPSPKHKVGISYRSRANVKVNGRVVIEDLVSGAAQGYDTFPYFESGARSDIGLPNNITFGYAYEPSEKWAVEFDMGITGWDAFKDQDFDFDRPNATLRGLGRIPRDYNESLSFHFGGHRKIRKNIDLVGGFFFYEAASPKNHVDNFLPDANRYGWSFGTSYQWTDRFRIDFTYTFILFGSRHISNPTTVAKGQGNVDGRYTSIIHGPMVTMTYQFDFPGEKTSSKKTSPPAINAGKAVITR